MKGDPSAQRSSASFISIIEPLRSLVAVVYSLAVEISGVAQLGSAKVAESLCYNISMKKSVLEPLVEQGLGLRSIAKLLEKSPTNVRYWVHKHGLELKQKPFGRGYTTPRIPFKCGRCGETDPTKFYGHKRSMCGPCHNAYTTRQGQDKRLRAIKELGGRCIACGFDRYPCSLDLHHRNRKVKDPNYRSLRGWSWNNILLELKKCVLLCKNCHAAVHAGLLKI